MTRFFHRSKRSVGALRALLRSAAAVTLVALALGASGSAQSFCEPGSAGTLPCVCGNPPSGPGRGCNNSLNLGGAALTASGNASISADTLVVTVSSIGSAGATCSGSVLALTSILIQGTMQTSGAPFFDGVRCVAGDFKRIEVATSSSGVYTSSVGISATSTALGDQFAPGANRYYFLYYRDPCPAFACTAPADLVNTSNAFKVTWAP